MKQQRREFLKWTSGLAMGAALAPLTGKWIMDEEPDGRIRSFGLQLYTLRDDLLNDPKNILKQVASYGYKQVESYEGPNGMFWGMSNMNFKNTMDDLGMTIISSHCDITKDFEKKADEAAAIGMKYLIYNWPSKKETMDEFKMNAELFNKCGEVCRKAGIRFANHNYDQSFIPIGGEVPMDVLMKITDPSIVDYQMDIYWVVFGGADPIKWLKKYPNRFRLCHIKDRIKGATERDASCNLGAGSIDFTPILKTAKQNGMQYFIAEQERYDGTTPMKAVEADAEYIKKLKI